MKIKKGNKVYPFITGDDVIITKGIKHPGKTVDEVIKEVDETLDIHQKEIDKLKSNMKYVYAYGGVGGKGSGGSGGNSSSGNATLFISLGGHQLQNGGNAIVLNEPGIYTVEGNVSNSNGETFYVSLEVGGREIPIPALSTEKNRCRFSVSVNLPRNGEIKVVFYDSEYSPLSSINQNYIVNPHTFDVKFMYQFESGGKIQEGTFDSSNEYFIGDTAHKNPFIDSSFKIDLPNVSNVFLKYSIGDTDVLEEDDEEFVSGQGIQQFDVTDISNNHFKIYLDKLRRLGKRFTDESNTGTYMVSVTLNYTVNGEVVEATSSFRITLIPNYLYINVRNPQDLLYDTLEDLHAAQDKGVDGVPEKYLTTGVYTSFYCKIYEGTIKTSRQQYPLTFNSYDMWDDDSDSDTPEVFKNDPTITEYRTGITEQVEMTRPISVAFVTPGIKKLEFITLGQKTSNHDDEKPVVKYIYIKEYESEITWTPDVGQQSFYFKANSGVNTYSDNFPKLSSGTTPLELSENSSQVVLTNENWTPEGGYETTILSFGIQYSAVNNDSTEILRTYSDVSSNTPDIILYPNKLFSDTNKKICIPKESNFDKSISEQYHLVQIVRYKIGTNNSGYPQYASYLYIDGELESNKPSLDGNQLFIGKIVLNNVNIVYNLINIQYLELAEPQVAKENRTSSIDGIIYQYNLAYKEIMHTGTVTNAEKKILKVLDDIKFDGENVIVDQSLVKTIAPYIPIPTMMMEFTPSDETAKADFINALLKGYPNGDTSFGRRDINLFWCDGLKPGTKTSLTQIHIPQLSDSDGTVYTGTWGVELQGTSTMRNRIKNFTLDVLTTNSIGDKVLLMSPNYDKNNSKTFLPERAWTLKADIADSAHANNTSIGKFVNEVCTPFSNSNNMHLTEDVAKYVKNTLEGFPILMFFKIGSDVYYFGVYNFNMGRQSYYNLGYHTAEDMTDMIGNITNTGDSSFSFSLGSGEVISTLAIGEIQDNFAQFDFHQCDDTVLFQPSTGAGSDITRMFGTESKLTGVNKGATRTTLSNLVKSVVKAGAYCFANIDKQPVSSRGDSNDCVNRYDIESYIDDNNNIKYIEKVPDPGWQLKYNGIDKIWTYNSDLSFDALKNDVDNLLRCIYTETLDNVKNDPFLDFSSVSEYYTICMAFGMVDSILKNMNIKSWDGHKCYIAFYDMDCALEENNAGGEDVSYLAATDYWRSDSSKGYVEPVIVNHDYWDDKLGKGFDFSSSYLFAIAKYAQAILNKLDGKTIILNNYPQQFWAKIRQPNGELRNADYFIDNYFSSGIGKIPSYLASLNYQVKYLYKGTILDENGNETETRFIANESAFNGTRLEKVRDWLNKRLHFLDVVFNIQGISIPIGGAYSTPSAEDTLLSTLTGNPDVVILTDVFSTPNSKSIIMGSNALPVNVYAPMNTPFIINRGSSNDMYLLTAGADKPNSIRITATRSESYRFLGSKEFTNVSMIEPFLTNAYMINSNNLEEIIYGGRDVPATNAPFVIISTSVKKIKFNIPTFEGSLDIKSDGLNGQALYSLDISKTGFTCELKDLKNLKSLNISSMNNSNAVVSMTECPLEGELCTISGTDDNPTTLMKLSMAGVSGKFELRNTKIKDISFTTNPDKEAEITIIGNPTLQNLTLNGFKKIVVRDCPNIQKLVIESPEKCEELIIDIPESSDRTGVLSGFNNVYMINGVDTTFTGVFDFTSFTNLKTLGLTGSEAVVIKIPNHKVSVTSFRDNKKLEFVDTSGKKSVIELTTDSTFFNCPYYGMRQSWYSIDTRFPYPITGTEDEEKECNYTRMCISGDCTSLANTFYRTSSNVTSQYTRSNRYTNTWGQTVFNSPISNYDAKQFIEKFVKGIAEDEYVDDNNVVTDPSGETIIQFGPDCRGNITSLQGCFYNQRGISYRGGESDIIPDLNGYTSLRNISMMYYGTNVRFLSADVLSLPFENNTNAEENILIMDNVLGLAELSVSRNAFKNVSYRIDNLSSMILSIYGTSTVEGDDYKTLLNTDKNNDGYFNIINLLCPQLKEGKTVAESVEDYIPFTRLTYFNSFNVNPQQWIDYRDLFKLCPNVSSLIGFLNGDLTHAKLDGMLHACKKLVSIDSSFIHTGYVEKLDPIDLYEFFDWTDTGLYNSITNLFTSSSTVSSVGFSLNKTISNDHFLEIMSLLHNYKNITRLSNIFSYCTIEGYKGSEIKLEKDMDKITNISSLFYKCKSHNLTPLRIRRSFFEHLPNVTILTNTFYGVYFDHMLSYDFFYKQLPESEAATEEVYLTPDSSSKVILKTVKYRSSLINDLSNCFCNAKFVGCDCWFDPSDEVNTGLAPFNDVVNNDKAIKEYYKSEYGSFVKYTVSENTAVADTKNNFTNYVEFVKISGLTSDWHLNNHSLDEDMGTFNNTKNGRPYITNEFNIYPTYCCLPPDIFYGCNRDCDLTNVFANTNIIGVIPQHLLSKSYVSKLENMFANVNILPNVIYHYDSRIVDKSNYNDYLALIDKIPVDEDIINIPSSVEDNVICEFKEGDEIVLFRNANGELRRRRPISYAHNSGKEEHLTNYEYIDFNKSQFVYVPQGYTINQNLSNAFTFRYNLPAQVDLFESNLINDGIDWPAGNYDSDHSPENRPDLWPYYTQYFFMLEDSVLWNRVTYMNYPFISDAQDIDFTKNQEKVFSSNDADYKVKWWSDTTNIEPETWDTQTRGLFNVFLNLCGKRDVRTGMIKDNGCSISKAWTNNPQLNSFISGILLVFLNGKIFDDGLDAGLFTPMHSSSNIIQYSLGFGRNVILPQINYVTSDPSKHSEVLLFYNSETAKFYDFMFTDSTSMKHYGQIFSNLSSRIIKDTPKYIVR